ncbi:bifunctional metallophosphatase/5'-nucleotidase [Staphylococcus massiliensis CCUG 55927]|uniref:bifunctional metallophosphatase/5'-nucleotidase n=1 Tax=Staphylococcus massiliensis TaxID=555791 RepID=UPI0002F36232|nr:bifunctional UDP-sugar hydrolase/5'-nucleotidase [Staphylococcus massiliensis]PNZ98060.1 bifunctional metallophosphatase/5'-nucleotidase [Staphylococcus massiliensis CCUG 55927]
MKVTLYHTNDIHSHLHEYQRLVQYMHEHRPKLSHPSLYLDIGDHVDLSLPVTEGTLGKRNVELLNDANCDIATIGNNEGMTLPHDALNTLYDDADFVVTCANIFDEDGYSPNRIAMSYTKDIEGVKFLFIAATAPFTPFYRALDWVVVDPLEAIKDEIAKHKGQYDVLIVMSHVGIFFDERLCDACPEIDVIFGSHTHHYFERGEYRNGVLMAAAAKYGWYLGEVTLEIEDAQVRHKEAVIHPLEDMPQVETAFDEEGKEILSTPVMEKSIHLERKTDVVTETSYLLAESINEFTGADCTLINAGLIVKDIQKDVVTEYDIHQMLPHPINVVRANIKGHVLKRIIMESRKQEYLNKHAQGLGFRGDIFGGYIWYQAGYIELEERYFVNGEEVIDDKTYTLGTVDMYTFGRYFPILKEQPLEYVMPEFLRDIFKKKLLSM